MRQGQTQRKNRLLKDQLHDVYRSGAKLSEPTVCPKCEAYYNKGRWTWNPAPADAVRAACPACRRIADKYPAGFIQLKGEFFNEHREEILNLVRNIETVQKADRPLERIMDIEDLGEHTLVTTTGVNIARRIGDSLARSYQGEFSFRYVEDDKSIRVYWER
ncbi:MAG: BCAM0308 family protein [Anaerolineae bacterium]|nr:BCAM0308 family protein [Anaerolineae bacterium]